MTIPSGSTTADIQIFALNDLLVEGPDTVNVQLAAGRYNGFGGTQTVSIIDVPPLISVASMGDVYESGAPKVSGGGVFRFTRTLNLAQAHTFTYTISGTATPGVEYAPLSGSVTFLAGAATADVPVTPVQDDLNEGNETVTVVWDPPPTPRRRNLCDANHSRSALGKGLRTGSSGGATRLCRSRRDTGGLPGLPPWDVSAGLPVTVSIAGTAVAGTDYTTLGTTVTIPPGQAFLDVPVTPLYYAGFIGGSRADRRSSPSTYEVTGGGAATVTLGITPPTVSIQATIPNASEAGPVNGAVTLTRVGDTSTDLQVSLTSVASAQNIQPLPASVTIPAGNAIAVVPIVPFNDGVVESGASSVAVTIASGAGYVVGTPASATVSIADSSFDFTYDGNGDGLPDWWQIYWFGTTEMANGGAADSWNDDGVTNLYKFQHGLDPTAPNPASTVTQEAPGGPVVNLQIYTPLE